MSNATGWLLVNVVVRFVARLANAVPVTCRPPPLKASGAAVPPMLSSDAIETRPPESVVVPVYVLAAVSTSVPVPDFVRFPCAPAPVSVPEITAGPVTAAVSLFAAIVVLAIVPLVIENEFETVSPFRSSRPPAATSAPVPTCPVPVTSSLPPRAKTPPVKVLVPGSTSVPTPVLAIPRAFAPPLGLARLVAYA